MSIDENIYEGNLLIFGIYFVRQEIMLFDFCHLFLLIASRFFSTMANTFGGNY